MVLASLEFEVASEFNPVWLFISQEPVAWKDSWITLSCTIKIWGQSCADDSYKPVWFVSVRRVGGVDRFMTFYIYV